MRVLDDDSEAASSDRVNVDGANEVGDVPLARSSGRRDLADLVEGRAPKLLPLEVLLDLLDEFLRRLDAGRLEELDLHHLRVLRARAHVHRRPHTLALEEVARDGGSHDVQI